MEKWPAWSAPLLGGFGGGLAGLALTGDPRFPFPPAYATLGGVALGMLAGLIVWLRDKLRPTIEAPPSVPTQRAVYAPSSRRTGLLYMAAGIACLAANHAMALAAAKKFLPLVCGGSVFLALGLAGIILPQILTAGATGERVPWWGHIVGGILAVGGLALGLYLWLVVY